MCVPELADLGSGNRPRFPALTVPGLRRTVAATTDRSYYRERVLHPKTRSHNLTEEKLYAAQKMI